MLDHIVTRRRISFLPYNHGQVSAETTIERRWW